MKTTNIKMILCLVFLRLVHVSQAQSLFINGRIYDKHQNSVLADYKLITCNEIVVTGSTKKLKVELQLGKDYVLIISKKGFASKTIKFSTQTQIFNDYTFLFDVILDKSGRKNSNSEINSSDAFIVFFDKDIQNFNYCHLNKNESSY